MSHCCNQTIRCTVNQCMHHEHTKNLCALDSITVGTHEANPTQEQCTKSSVSLFVLPATCLTLPVSTLILLIVSPPIGTVWVDIILKNRYLHFCGLPGTLPRAEAYR